MSPIIELALGLILVFVVLSLLASGVQEVIASVLSLRAKTLKSGLEKLPGKKTLVAFYGHGLVRTLGRPDEKGDVLPSYMPPRTLAIALAEIAFKQNDGEYPQTAEDLKAALEKVEDSPVKDALASIAGEVGPNLGRLRERLAELFDDSLDRISGWYARQARYNLFAIGAVLAVVLNVDIVAMAREPWVNAILRAELAGFAEEAARAGGEASAAVSDAMRTEVLASLPIGWTDMPKPYDVLRSLPGWLVTAFAVSLGAPFWFDRLGRVARLRGAGEKPGRKKKFPTESRQTIEKDT